MKILNRKLLFVLTLAVWLTGTTLLKAGAQTDQRQFQTLSNASKCRVAVVPRAGDYQFQFDQPQVDAVSVELKAWVDKNGEGGMNASAERQKVWLPSNFRLADFKRIVETEARRRLNELFPNKIPSAMEGRLKIEITITAKPPGYTVSITL